MSEPWLILETSGRGGRVGLAIGGQLAGTVELDPARRHNRDLAPAGDALLKAAGLAPKDLFGVAVSVGPGSYTGLRVGVMSAKMLAYATGCRLVAVPTFHAIAEQSPAETMAVDVIADALQGHVYVQRFHKAGAVWTPIDELRIVPVVNWAESTNPQVWVSGPGLTTYDAAIPSFVPRVPPADRVPGLAAVLKVGLMLPALAGDAILQLEPIYLRGSSAEEKARTISNAIKT
ncbi:tRNA (adenosine(37)-N6)-threonylcarbamoyltransferase complex dimerization subunit type 1 TsaB [Fimbriiglobus ruber]|uniref:TsaB protein, required for threonylcarbamoyladenosine (T(6)A) formation in tRNA n=1 Tax=Fimbriiglobus ruber TaxID=1908690 RepID=A0A225DXS4_9BACT|nr:tRNA (adenosine(37)-N6)-threonylcarbamoyltransferase complex dimerization subunit type 1 TsaB [Fimbriiglobus ruber]OWK44374.1 TsaB protein, required for threonylcarbamoyladenosine (t(6)A) formation in tRNA [Fimbriiglobus ruber]